MPDNPVPSCAMVLAAGLGTRMRPITDTVPKPLVRVAGKALLDHALDAAVAAGVVKAVVNVHYLPEQIEAHLAARRDIEVGISDERKELLDSGGGIKHALPQIGKAPFYILNSDTFWIESDYPFCRNLQAMREAWDPAKMDLLLLLSPTGTAIGFDGTGDFFMDGEGRLERRGEKPSAPFVYAGAIIARPELFAAVKDRKFSLNRLFDDAIAAGRLHGVVLEGLWLHVGTPAAIAEAERAVEAFRMRASA